MRKLIVTLSLCVFSICAAQAQLKLTLEDAVRIALDENPTLKVAEMEIERFDYVKKTTIGSHLPQLSIDTRYNYNAKAQQMSKSMKFASDGTSSLVATANLTVPLYAPAVYRLLKLNSFEMEAAVESARGSQINLIAEVKKSFYNILLAQQSIEVLEQTAQTVEETVEQTKVKYENGLASEYDLLTAQVQYNNLQPTILQTKNSVEVAKLLLKMYLSLPEDVEIELEGDLDQIKGDIFAGLDELTTDVSENSDLRTLEIQSEMLSQQLKLTNAAHLPTLAAYGTGSYNGSQVPAIEFGPNGMVPSGKLEYFEQFPINVGVQLSIPIFAGMTNVNKARQIKNQISQLELSKLYAAESTKIQARMAINTLLTAREKMYSEETNIEQATKAYDISNTRYEAGTGTILELNSAQLSMTQAQLNYSQAIFDYLSAKSDYDKVIGKEN